MPRPPRTKAGQRALVAGMKPGDVQRLMRHQRKEGKKRMQGKEAVFRRKLAASAPSPIRALVRRAAKPGKGKFVYFADKPPRP